MRTKVCRADEPGFRWPVSMNQNDIFWDQILENRSTLIRANQGEECRTIQSGRRSLAEGQTLTWERIPGI